MPQQIRHRTEQTIEFTANGKKSESVDRGMVYRELYLKLSCVIQDDETNGIAAADIRPGDEWAVIRQIELLLNSNDSIRYVSGEQLQWFNYFWYGTPRISSALKDADGSTGATYAVESWLVLPFWMPRSVKPIDTALDARLLSDLKVRIDWGDITDIVDTTDASFATEPKLEIFTLESFGLEGPFNTMRIFSQEYNDVPTSDKFRVELPVGNIYRSFLLNTKDSDGNDLVNAIDNIRLRSGSVIFADINARLPQKIYPMRTGAYPVHGEDELLFVSENSLAGGWTYFDLVTDGLLTEAIDTLGFSSLVMELQTNQAIDSLRVLPTEIIPLRNNGNGNGG